MKGSLAAIMQVAVAATDLELAGDLIVTAVADEEALSIGSERIAETVTADAAIVTEPTGLDIAVAHRGFVWLELETRVAPHTAPATTSASTRSLAWAAARRDRRARRGLSGR